MKTKYICEGDINVEVSASEEAGIYLDQGGDLILIKNQAQIIELITALDALSKEADWDE